MYLTKIIVACVCLFLGTVSGYSDTAPCSGDCLVVDPSLIRRDDGTYFRFSTHNGLTIATSTSLNGPWTNVGMVLEGGKSIIKHPSAADPWAPDVSKVGDLYYCYYSLYVFPHRSATGVATSPTMDPGTWTDHGEVFRSTIKDTYNANDCNLIQHPNGGLYLLFGSYWNDLHVFEMESPYAVKGSPIQVSYNATDIHAEEGGFMFQHDNYFYLFFSAGQCCVLNPPPAAGVEYRINVCRSDSVTGPFYDAAGVPCLEGGGYTVLTSFGRVYAPGGQGVLSTDQGDILYYHYINLDLGYGDENKSFGWHTLTWSNGWPHVL